MTDFNLIKELEFIYRTLISNGNFDKAQEVLLKLTDLKTRNESTPTPDRNILLG